jgi:hypothetical protein
MSRFWILKASVHACATLCVCMLVINSPWPWPWPWPCVRERVRMYARARIFVLKHEHSYSMILFLSSVWDIFCVRCACVSLTHACAACLPSCLPACLPAWVCLCLCVYACVILGSVCVSVCLSVCLCHSACVGVMCKNVHVTVWSRSQSHCHGVFISATHPKGKWTTNPNACIRVFCWDFGSLLKRKSGD